MDQFISMPPAHQDNRNKDDYQAQLSNPLGCETQVLYPREDRPEKMIKFGQNGVSPEKGEEGGNGQRERGEKWNKLSYFKFIKLNTRI